MVTRAEYSGEKHETYLNIHPLLKHSPGSVSDLHQHEGQQRACDYLPCAFDPEVYDPPPPELVLDHALGVDHSRQVHQGQEGQSAQQGALDAGPPF